MQRNPHIPDRLSLAIANSVGPIAFGETRTRATHKGTLTPSFPSSPPPRSCGTKRRRACREKKRSGEEEGGVAIISHSLKREGTKEGRKYKIQCFLFTKISFCFFPGQRSLSLSPSLFFLGCCCCSGRGGVGASHKSSSFSPFLPFHQPNCLFLPLPPSLSSFGVMATAPLTHHRKSWGLSVPPPFFSTIDKRCRRCSPHNTSST